MRYYGEQRWRRIDAHTHTMVGRQFRYFYNTNTETLRRENMDTGLIEEVHCRSLPQGYPNQQAISQCAAKFSLARSKGYVKTLDRSGLGRNVRVA